MPASNANAEFQATSFSNHEGTLAEKFPGHRGAHMRAKYLPLNREPLNPHPDNGILLDVVTTGNVKFSKDKQSYLNLTPFSIRREWIIEIQWRGKAQLTASAFDTVKKHIAKLSPDHPVVALWTEEKTIAITARRVPARFSTTKESAVGEQGFSMWTYRQESASYNYNYYTPYQPPRAETRGFCATLSWTVFWIVFCLLAIFWYEGDSC